MTHRPCIALLAPMQIELDPLTRELGLTRDDDHVWRGDHAGARLVALVTTMGMGPAAEATRRAIELGAQLVMVVGIAGGLDPERVAIGDVLNPEAYVHRPAGTRHTPLRFDDRPVAGTISCGDDLITDAGGLAALAAEGVIALDMETAAVGATCEAAGVPWTAFRAISDFAGGGLVSDEIFAMTKPDGSADLEAITAFLAKDPSHLARLEQLAHDSGVAAEAAAAAAIAALPAAARTCAR